MYTKFNENYKLEKWYPAKYSDLCSMYDIRSIKDLIEGLFIELVSDSIVDSENEKYETIYIHWPRNYVSYMVSESGARNLISLDENNHRWTFFKIMDSKYVDFIAPYEPQILDSSKKPIAGEKDWEE